MISLFDMKKALFFLIWMISFTFFAQPKIFIQNTYHKFDFIEEASKVFDEFKIQNLGDEELVIYNVQATCRCSVVDYPKSILPKSEGLLKVIIEPKSKKGKWMVGIRIDSNDPETPTLSLKVDLNVVPIFQFSILEKELLFTKDELNSIKLKMFTSLRDSFSIYNISIYPENITVFTEPNYFTEVKGKDGFNITLNFPKPFPKGVQPIELTITTSLQELPIVKHSFFITVKDYINAEPEILYFDIKGNPGALTAIKPKTPLYKNPSNKEKAKQTLDSGPAYKIVSYQDGYYLIDYKNSEKYWVSEDDIKILDSNYISNVTLSSIRDIKFNILNVDIPEGFNYTIEKKDDQNYFLQLWYKKPTPKKVNGLIVKIELDYINQKTIYLSLMDNVKQKIESFDKKKKIEKKL